MENYILPPFRPIISGIGCLTENMSAYVDKILQTLFQKISSYIQDTTQFLSCISKIKSVLIMLLSFQWMLKHYTVASNTLMA